MFGFENFKVEGVDCFDEYINFQGIRTHLEDYYKSKSSFNKEVDNLQPSFIDPIRYFKPSKGIFSLIIDPDHFVSKERFEELRAINQNKFDLSKLLKICNELNLNYATQNYFSVSILTRTLINHVPPVFNQDKFQNVYSEYGSKSFKASMKILDSTSRKIADNHLHSTISKVEVLPNRTQVNFKHDLDVLLGEIVKWLKVLE